MKQKQSEQAVCRHTVNCQNTSAELKWISSSLHFRSSGIAQEQVTLQITVQEETEQAVTPGTLLLSRFLHRTPSTFVAVLSAETKQLQQWGCQ